MHSNACLKGMEIRIARLDMHFARVYKCRVISGRIRQMWQTGFAQGAGREGTERNDSVPHAGRPGVLPSVLSFRAYRAFFLEPRRPADAPPHGKHHAAHDFRD